MISRRVSQPASNNRPCLAPETLEPRRLLAAVFDSGGFESPRYTTGPLEGQDALGPWLTDSEQVGVATVLTEVVASGEQAVRMTRPGAADGDTRYGVIKPFTPTGVLSVVRISWDMNVPRNVQPSVPFGPFFGVEAYDASVTQFAPQLAGSLGVDAATGDVLYQDGTTGFLTETGFHVQLGEWNSFTLELDYAAKTYTVYVNGDDKATTGFVDNVIGFTDAPLAALAATAESKPFATGTAYFDNYVIDVETQFSQAAPRVNQVYVSGSSWTQEFKDYLEDTGQGSSRYGFVIPDRDQLNELPWINLDQVSIRFSEDVLVDPGDLAVRGVNVPEYALDPASFRYDADTRTATWRLANGQVFANDRLLLDLDGEGEQGVKDKDGNLLDGEWRNPGGPNQNRGDNFPSGDGSPGGDFRFRINTLPGDTDRNGVVAAPDFGETKKRFFTSPRNPTNIYSTYNAFYDVDGNAFINAVDFSEVKKRFFKALPPGEPGGFSTSLVRAEGAGDVLPA